MDDDNVILEWTADVAFNATERAFPARFDRVGLGFLVKPTVSIVRKSLLRFFPDSISALPSTILELEPRIAPWSIFASLAIAIGVGVVFGLYPARRAAMMDPIEALRHE